MYCRQFNLRILAIGLMLTLGPTLAHAQTTGSSGGSSGGSGVGSSSGGGTSGGSGATGGDSSTSSSSTTATIKTIATGNSATSIPASSNVFGPYMANPLSRGLASSYYPNTGTFGTSNTATPIFGKALYAATTTTTGTGGAASTNSLAGTGFSTVGMVRAPSYITVPGSDLPAKVHDPVLIQNNLQALLDRSSFLKNRGNVQVAVAGDVVILRGQVQSAKELRIAEGVVRTMPGVRAVLNELQVVGLPK